MRRIFVLMLPLAFVFLSSCDSGPRTYAVSGKVTFAGESVNNGEIAFEGSDKRVEGGRIADGTYRVQLKAGQYTIRISAAKMVPLPPGQKTVTGETEMNVQFIPEQYNTKSELTADISGQKELNFELTEKAAK